MMLQEILRHTASDLSRIANQDHPSSVELHFISNALGNLAEAIDDGKFDRARPRLGGAPSPGPSGYDAAVVTAEPTQP